MNLLEIRQQFVKLTGRYDLINTDNSDNGADWFINQGQDYIERNVELGSLKLAEEYEFTAESISKYLSNLKSVYEVYFDSQKLEKLSYGDFFSLGDVSPGTPTSFTVVKKKSPDSPTVNQKGVLLSPPPDTDGTLLIIGKFGQDKMLENTDSNMWSENHSGLLLKSAMLQLESFYRNTQGYRDLRISVDEELAGLEADYVDEIYNNPKFEKLE